MAVHCGNCDAKLQLMQTTEWKTNLTSADKTGAFICNSWVILHANYTIPDQKIDAVSKSMQHQQYKVSERRKKSSPMWKTKVCLVGEGPLPLTPKSTVGLCT